MATPKPITIQFTSEDVRRFWSYVSLSPNQGPQGTCWEWTARRYAKGLPYGTIKIQQGMYIASRIAFILCYGQDPWPLYVCHHCDNPSCCRPDHLFLGTPDDNQQDMVNKGRSCKGDRNGLHKHPERAARGERQHLAKMTVESVIQIRELYATGHYSSRKLGRMFKMDKSCILDIVIGHTWKHVPFPVAAVPHADLPVGSHRRRASRTKIGVNSVVPENQPSSPCGESCGADDVIA